MCGRYAFFQEHEELERLLGRLEPLDYPRRYNISPTQLGLVALQDGKRHLAVMPWGLQPAWATKGGAMINARWESAAEKPYFRSAWKSRRCAVPASGWFEWKEEGGAKQPYFARLHDRAPMLFAGLWEEGSGYAILTKDAEQGLREVHDRMPVILGEEEVGAWLDVESPRDALPGLVRDWAESLEVYPVDRRVGRPAFDVPEACEAIRT
ncbi:MAG: SOS response-associated peptidase [Fimbriimonadaceae bacterium]|nr:SOS response-associated peptidase [Fimbriimonadaceae bacterium]